MFNPFEAFTSTRPEQKEKSLLEKLRSWHRIGGLALMALFGSGQVPMEKRMSGEGHATSTESQGAQKLNIATQAQVVNGRVEMKNILSNQIKPVSQEQARQFDNAKALNPEDYAKLIDSVEQRANHDIANRLIANSSEGKDASSIPPTKRITKIVFTGSSSPEAFRMESPTHRSVKPGNVEQANVRLAEKRAEQAVKDMEIADVVGHFRSAGFEIDGKVLEKAAKGIDAQETQFTDDEVKELNVIAAKYPGCASGADEYVNISRLVELYNTGHVNNPDHAAALDRIVAAKRRVDIAIEYEVGIPTSVSVPLPLVVLDPSPSMMPAEGTEAWRHLPELYDPSRQNRAMDILPQESRKKRVKPDPTRVTRVIEPPKLTDRPVGSHGTSWTDFTKDLLTKVSQDRPVSEPPKPLDIPAPRRVERTWADLTKDLKYSSKKGAEEKTRSADLPKTEPVKNQTPEVKRGVFDPSENISEEIRRVTEVKPSDPAYPWMVWQTVLGDLDIHMNDPRSLEWGTDYAGVAHEIYRYYDYFKNDQDRVDSAAQLLIQQWIMHDAIERQVAGIQDRSTGLDYFNQPKQIQWAKLHARVLLDMVKEKRKQDSAKGDVEKIASIGSVGMTIEDPIRSAYTELLSRRVMQVREKYPEFSV